VFDFLKADFNVNSCITCLILISLTAFNMTEWDMFGQSLRNAFTLPKVNSKQPIIQSGLIQKYVY